MKKLLIIFSVILLSGLVFFPAIAEPDKDKQALLDFIHNIHSSHPHIWNATSSVCNNWVGVTCDSNHSRVIALRLPGLGFHGSIPPNTISRLSEIQLLSLRSNGISGSFPTDFSKLKSLTTLYLQGNNFSGPLPLDFSVWKNLTVLDLSNNGFSGSIPISISSLSVLTSLNLANNSLSGQIPDIIVPTLQQIDFANNNLTGAVPKSLQRFPSWAFFGNNISLDNYALPPALPVHPPSSQPSRKHMKISEPAILGIVLGGCLMGFVVIALLMIYCYYKREKEIRTGTKTLAITSKKAKLEGSLKEKLSENQDKDSKFVFFEDTTLAFDLEDLLRASAEILGKGTFGITYRAALEDSTTVVVKRLKEVSAAKREFEQQMELVGNIKHVNVSGLRAYYFSKDEKLMVYDFHPQGSVSNMLHGKRSREGQAPLDWETRLRIAVGTARGIAHIHTLNGGKLVHGNVKASNIFLNSQSYGCVSDGGLVTLMTPVPPAMMRVAGYRAPEVIDTRKATQASDVYSFGVVLLELLTGRSPIHATGGEQDVIHLVRWVNSVVREEWTAEVFDVDLLRYPNIEEEMVEMLQIGMACVVRLPEERPKMGHVVRMVEEIRQAIGNENNQPPSSSGTVLESAAPKVGSSSSSSISTPTNIGS